MAHSVDAMIDDILRREGGFINHPDDRGGPTNFGITQDTLSAWRGEDVTAADVRGLEAREARVIYRANYFELPGIGQLPEAIQPIMFDAAVNHGPAGAARLLQRALQKGGQSVATDGAMGPMTLMAAHQVDPSTLNADLIGQRHQLYTNIIARDPTQQTFERGWRNRLAEFEKDLATPRS